MNDVFFEIDFLALLLALLAITMIFFINRWKTAYISPRIYFSHLNAFHNLQTMRSSLSLWPKNLLYGSLGLFLLAFIDPHLQIAKEIQQTPGSFEGIAIYLVVDQSGSMAQKVHVIDEKQRFVTIPKIDLLKQVTLQFVQQRPQDLIGLVSFARRAQVLSPLTLDHKAIISKLSNLQVVANKDEDGTAMGYALLKTINLITATRHYAQELDNNIPDYLIKNAIIILVTDGFPAPNPLDQEIPLRNVDMDNAASIAKENHVRIYLITIDPALQSSEFIPHRNLMQRVADTTGGKYYLIDNVTSLSKIYDDINKIEKSSFVSFEGLSRDQQPQRFKRISFYPYLIGMGMLLLLGAIGLETVVLRPIP